MASNEHSWSVDPLSLEVRHESGKFVVSHPKLNLHAEAGTLDKAYRQMTELIENSALPNVGDKQDMGWNGMLRGLRVVMTTLYSLARVTIKWLGQQQLMRSFLVLATKTTLVTIVSVSVVALMGITTLSLLKPQITASIKSRLGPAAIAKKVSSISPDDQMLYKKNLEVIIEFLLPLANTVQPLVRAIMQEPSQGAPPENIAPIDLALPPKGRPSPD